MAPQLWCNTKSRLDNASNFAVKVKKRKETSVVPNGTFFKLKIERLKLKVNFQFSIFHFQIAALEKSR